MNEHERRDIEIEQLIATCRTVLDRWEGNELLAGYLYGSVLNRRGRSDSDLDIALLDREEERLGWDAQAALMDELERDTGLPVDLRMIRDGTCSYQLHVIDQGRLIFDRDDNAVRAFARSVREQHEKRRSREALSWDLVVGALARKAGEVQ